MLNMKRKLVFTVIAMVFSLSASAQCAMCRAVLESEEGQTAAEGINNGILYLMAIPYILVGGLGFLAYKKLKNRKL